MYPSNLTPSSFFFHVLSKDPCPCPTTCLESSKYRTLAMQLSALLSTDRMPSSNHNLMSKYFCFVTNRIDITLRLSYLKDNFPKQYKALKERFESSYALCPLQILNQKPFNPEFLIHVSLVVTVDIPCFLGVYAFLCIHSISQPRFFLH